MVYKFPFIGAGKANYFEWAEVQIIFKNTPSEEQKKQIEKKIPFPINSIIWWEKNALSTGSESEVQIDIASFYQTKDGNDPKNPEDYGDDGWFFATDSQIDLFNDNIEKWLDEVNQICFILLAFRREGKDSERTLFSDWHQWSMKKFKSILPYFDKIILNHDYKSVESYMLRKILYMQKMAGEKINREHLKYLSYPKKEEVKAFLIYPFKIYN